jgi:hypothetical protein
VEDSDTNSNNNICVILQARREAGISYPQPVLAQGRSKKKEEAALGPAGMLENKGKM